MLTALATALARNLRVASLVVAAAMIGVGGAAATVANVADSTPTADPSVTVTADDPGDQGEDADVPEATETEDATEATDVTETEDATEATDATETEDATDATDATNATDAPVTTVACEDATTHGEYVSSVAHAAKGAEDHADQVRTAAQSDCGKPDATETEDSTDTTDATESTDTEDATESTDDATESAAPSLHGKGHVKAAKVKATTHGKSADHRGLRGKSSGKARHNHR